MSALSVNWTQWIPVAVLTASLLGSGHCVAMCGGLVLATTQNRKSIWSYHLGRLAGYCGLGAIAGFLGEKIFQSAEFSWIPWISTFMMAFIFIYLGIRIWLGKPLHLFKLPKAFFQKIPSSSSVMIGLFSAFLPCGWLHVFVLGAVGTQSPVLGALNLLFFWLGTLPALTFAPYAARKVFQPVSRRLPKLSAIMLILIGIGSLGMKMLPKTPKTSCSHQCSHEKSN